MYYFRQDKALDSSPSARVLQIREVYGGKHKSNESTGGTRGGGGEECKLVAANELRTTLLITMCICGVPEPRASTAFVRFQTRSGTEAPPRWRNLTERLPGE